MVDSFHPVAIVWEEGRDPWLWSPYEACMTMEEAQKAIKKFFENYPEYKPVMTWIQQFRGDTIFDIEKKVFAGPFGLSSKELYNLS